MAAELRGHALVEAEAESIRRDNEEHVTLLTIVLFDPHVADVEADRFDLLLGAMDVRHLDRRSIWAGVAAGERDPDSDAVSLEDHGLVRLAPPLHLAELER